MGSKEVRVVCVCVCVCAVGVTQELRTDVGLKSLSLQLVEIVVLY